MNKHIKKNTKHAKIKKANERKENRMVADL